MLSPMSPGHVTNLSSFDRKALNLINWEGWRGDMDPQMHPHPGFGSQHLPLQGTFFVVKLSRRECCTWTSLEPLKSFKSNHKQLVFRNLTMTPNTKRTLLDQPSMVFAHWDTRPFQVTFCRSCWAQKKGCDMSVPHKGGLDCWDGGSWNVANVSYMTSDMKWS